MKNIPIYVNPDVKLANRQPGDKVNAGDREYFVRHDGAFQRVDGHRQRKGKWWRKQRNKQNED